MCVIMIYRVTTYFEMHIYIIGNKILKRRLTERSLLWEIFLKNSKSVPIRRRMKP